MNDCLACKWPSERRAHTCAERTDPDYAKHLTPEAEAWLAERANPKFKPKPLPKPSLKPRKLTDRQRVKAEEEVRAVTGHYARQEKAA